MMSFTGSGVLEDERWTQFVAFLRGEDGTKILFSVTANDMASLSATQRKSGADALKEKGLEAIVVTDSRVTRGILTAVNWLGAQVTAHSWDTLDQAVAIATDNPDTQRKILEAATRFRRANS